MALNWNAFLNDEGLNLPNDRWPTSSAGQSTNTQPTTTSSSQRQSLSLAADPADLSSFDQPNRQDTYFSDAYYGSGDYFLSDLEVLEPLGTQIAGGGSTSESSPEPSNNIALGTHGGHTVFQQPRQQGYSSSQTPATTTRSSLSPSTSNIPGSAIQSSQALPNNTQYSSLFPDQSQSGLIEDLTFPNGPTGSAQIPTTASAALDNLATEITTTASMKRPAKSRPDVLSACWTSPLCPNHNKEGPPPNPSTCGGGCAPFLFSEEDPLATATINGQLLNNDTSDQNSPEGVVEIRPKLKRSESEVSHREPSGRTFSTSSIADIRPRVKSEASGDSPPNDQAAQSEQNDEPKGKGRRRLPHNQVERKYRESLNTQLDSLRRVVPALHQSPRTGDGVDIEDLPTPSKPSKAVVLASATAYIKQMEKDKKQLADENQLLRTRIKALQALVKCEDCSLMQYVMDLKIHNPT